MRQVLLPRPMESITQQCMQLSIQNRVPPCRIHNSTRVPKVAIGRIAWLTNSADSRKATEPKCQPVPILFSLSRTKTCQPTKHQLIAVLYVKKNRSKKKQNVSELPYRRQQNRLPWRCSHPNSRTHYRQMSLQQCNFHPRRQSYGSRCSQFLSGHPAPW
jgi:hypothetical protein